MINQQGQSRQTRVKMMKDKVLPLDTRPERRKRAAAERKMDVQRVIPGRLMPSASRTHRLADPKKGARARETVRKVVLVIFQGKKGRGASCSLSIIKFSSSRGERTRELYPINNATRAC